MTTDHDQDDIQVNGPSDPRAENKRKHRNMMLLFFVCAIIGGGGFIYLSKPEAQTQGQTNKELKQRLEQSVGSIRHPSLAHRRDYVDEYAKDVNTNLRNVKSKVNTVKDEVDSTAASINELRDEFASFLQQYQEDKALERQKEEDLQVVLDSQQNALNDLSSNPQSNGFDGFPVGSQPTAPQSAIAPSASKRPAVPPRKIERSSFKLNKKPVTKRTNKLMDTENYLPPGSYAKGRIIMGAKTSASVDAQSDPRPILIRIRDKARGPTNEWGEHTETDTRGCTVTAQAYGDISSEQGHAKLNEMTCYMANGKVRTTRVYGYIAHRGMYGVHTNVVMREGDLLENAFWAGMLGKTGEATGMLVGETSKSAVGTVNSSGGVKDAGLELLSGGFEQTGDQFMRYYLKRLEQIQPILPLKAGTEVVVVFMKGTSLDGEELIPAAKEKQRIPLGGEGSDVSAKNINSQLIDLINQSQRPSDATKTDWNNEFYN